MTMTCVSKQLLEFFESLEGKDFCCSSKYLLEHSYSLGYCCLQPITPPELHADSQLSFEHCLFQYLQLDYVDIVVLSLSSG